MADIPILFSAPMIRALLDGRKTMTRRIFKPDREPPPAWDGRYGFSVLTPARHVELRGVDLERGPISRFMPLRYAKGDRLWVRENHRLTDCDCTEACRGAGHVWYDATEDGYRNVADNRLRPSIHMPRWASRITLIVTAVKIERLQDISEADAIAEGSQSPLADLPPAARKAAWSERRAFAHIWDAINGAGAWDANPFVVATSFRVIKANIDAPEARIAA